MKTLSRKLALTLLAIEMITQSTKQDIENILFANYLDKEGQPDPRQKSGQKSPL